MKDQPVPPTASNPLVAFLDAEALKRGWSRERLSKEAGLSRDAIRNLENRGPRAGVNMATLQKLAATLGLPLSDLVAKIPSRTMQLRGERLAAAQGVAGDLRPASIEAPRGMVNDVPVLGTAIGGIVGGFRLTYDVIDYVRRPPALLTARDIYALYIENDSMIPRFWPGDLVFVHPHKPLAVGDPMIVQVANGEPDGIDAFIKIYKGRTAEWILAEQYNPVSQIKYARASVIATHKVLTLNELFGI